LADVRPVPPGRAQQRRGCPGIIAGFGSSSDRGIAYAQPLEPGDALGPACRNIVRPFMPKENLQL